MTSAHDAEVVVSFSGELDAGDADWVDEITMALDAGARRLVVDLVDVTFIDSSVVRSLVQAYRRVGRDGWVRIVYTHNIIRRVIEVCGLADALPQYTTVDAALRGAPSRLHPDDPPPDGTPRPRTDERAGAATDRGTI